MKRTPFQSARATLRDHMGGQDFADLQDGIAYLLAAQPRLTTHQQVILRRLGLATAKAELLRREADDLLPQWRNTDLPTQAHTRPKK